MRRYALRAALAAVALAPCSAPAQPRPLAIDDLYAFREVGDPQLDPGEQWVAFTSTRADRARDASDADLYMAPLDGGEPIRLTAREGSETRPRFSPDGRYLAFLHAGEDEPAQLWLLDRRGGEATALTSYRGSVSDLAWSPDSRRLALVVRDPDPEAEAEAASCDDEESRPKPIVIRRLEFKRDGEGYLSERRDHLHLFDVGSRESVQLTTGPYDDSQPAWSPDGRFVAFVSKRGPEPDAGDDSDVFVVEAAAGAVPRRAVESPGTDHSPTFSPDGRWIAYVHGGPPERLWYATQGVAVVPAEGGAPRLLTAALDRNASQPRFTPDGAALLFLLEDGGTVHLARVPVAAGAVERVVAGEREVSRYDVGRSGAIVVLESRPHRPFEVSRVAAGGLEPVTRLNDEWLSGIVLGEVRRHPATSADGTRIDGFLFLPPGHEDGERLPALLSIHGGPVDQYTPAFDFERQLLAAHGYAVLAPNPRGSSGYGSDFSHAIWADWGNLDYQDVMAAVDAAVAAGVADPDRLGVGGWSYGGILTNYVIVQTDRFAAAVSGSSEVNYTANYGHDHYQYEWETELGLPWESTELWIRLSPFFRLDEVSTPTLVLCGQEDWNVPLLNSEQLYQALRRLGVETELVVYPGEDHSIDRPSFRTDRWQRYLGWYDRHLKGLPLPPPGEKQTAGGGPETRIERNTRPARCLCASVAM